jgi:2-polyprenyl-6-methoxyphenol hydroxylase-like FAD-dependent oxidoreductase
MEKKAIIIGAGVAGPVLAMQLQKSGYVAEVYEARGKDNTKEGAFLGLTPNGLNVLKEFIDLNKLKADYTPGTMKFYNAKGKQIAELSTSYQKEKYGAETIQIKRSDLSRYTREAATAKGIAIHYQKVCVKVLDNASGVEAFFEDGTSASGDILVACDGTFSAVRKQLFPDAYKPSYTKLISTGGYARLDTLSKPTDSIHMTFGEKGFFAYAVSNKGDIWWFNNYHREGEPSREEFQGALNEEIKNYLLEVHKNDDPLFSKIIRASDEMIVYPVYDIPNLKKWYKANICLIGDAAHAVSPHVGQGASLALEDTAILAKLLDQESSVEQAFEKFQEARQERVKKIIKTARKIGDNKSKPNPIATWFRDKLIGVFIKGEMKKLDWVYGFRGDV